MTLTPPRPVTSGTGAPAGNRQRCSAEATCGPAARARGCPSTTTVTGACSTNVESSRKSTSVSRVNVVNSGGAAICPRSSGPATISSQIAGPAKSSSLSTNWNACT